MKNLTTILFIILLINKYAYSQDKFQYISPKNNAKLISLNSSIIAGAKEEIDFSNLPENIISVVGGKSGIHKVKIKLSNDGKTLIFTPIQKFEPNENVSVKINPGIKTIEGKEFSSISFNFATTPLTKAIIINPLSIIDDGMVKQINLIKSPIRNSKTTYSVNTDTLPDDFPQITIDTVNNPAPGKIFLTDYTSGNSSGYFLMILNNDGSIEDYKRLSVSGLDFKVQPNGNLSYAEQIQMIDGTFQSRYIILDTSLTPIDTFQCGNGYIADVHDFKLLPNGHAIMIATDPEPVDMSSYGGDPNATVLGCILQELDASKNVIFQWRSWDYIPITDSYADLTGKIVDYFHQNAVDVDHDGNYLLSSRTLSQILKIDRNTGNIIWKLGGKVNDFTFINEHEENSPTYFSYQHDIAVLPNGNITLFDNGSQHPTHYSRAVEYKLDEANKTAELIWEYRHSPDIFTAAMGSVQRLPNGNTIIGWGSASRPGIPAVTEVHPDKSVAIELSFPSGQTSYRAFKFPWKSQLPNISVNSYDALQGNTCYFYDNDDTTGITMKVNQIDAQIYNSFTITLYNYAPVNPKFNTNAPLVRKEYFALEGSSINSFQGTVHIDLNYHPRLTNPQNIIVYSRTQDDSSFKALATSYNFSKNELMFTTSNFGEFIFGEPLNIDSAYAPIPIQPKDEEIVNEKDTTKLIWGTKGIVSNYQLEVSKDSLFNSLIVDDTLSSTSYEFNTLDNDTKYFWRVKANNSSGESGWSDTASFSTSSPFITVLYPNGDEKFFGDSTYIIRWQDNLSNMVNINLIKNSTSSIIADSVLSETNAFSWNVPDSLEKASNYRIKITDVNDNNIFDSSDNDFIIITNTVGVKETNIIVKDYKLYQNFPNPFNPSTIIKYDLPKTSNVKISIFNVIGQRVAVLVKKIQNSGSHQVVWNAQNIASGVYFYKITATGINGKSNFISFKKAVLIK